MLKTNQGYSSLHWCLIPPKCYLSLEHILKIKEVYLLKQYFLNTFYMAGIFLRPGWAFPGISKTNKKFRFFSSHFWNTNYLSFLRVVVASDRNEQLLVEKEHVTIVKIVETIGREESSNEVNSADQILTIFFNIINIFNSRIKWTYFIIIFTHHYRLYSTPFLRFTFPLAGVHAAVVLSARIC